MDLFNGTHRLSSTMITSSSSSWFSQLVWSWNLIPLNENMTNNLFVSLIGEIGEIEDHLRYQITSDVLTHHLVGTINVYDHVIEIWSGSGDGADELMCQASGTPSELNLPLPFYLYTVECDSDVLENFLTTIFEERYSFELARLIQERNLFSFNVSDVFPILPLFGTFILTQTPLGQFIDQCTQMFDYRFVFIVTTACLGGTVLFLFLTIFCLSCLIRRKGRPKDTSGIQLVRSGSRYTLSL